MELQPLAKAECIAAGLWVLLTRNAQDDHEHQAGKPAWLGVALYFYRHGHRAQAVPLQNVSGLMSNPGMKEKLGTMGLLLWAVLY